MKTQDEINKAWNLEVQSNIGTLTLLVQPPQGIPGLGKRYQFELAAKDTQQLVADLKSLMKTAERQLQCDLVSKKATAKGIKLNIFLLGYRPDYCGKVNEEMTGTIGATAEQWLDITTKTTQRLRQTLGDSIAPYREDWTPTEKFQYRFETYIKYKEL